MKVKSKTVINILALVGLSAAILLVPVRSTMGQVGKEALKFCQEFGFSTEEDFVTRGPEPPDGNPIISDGDLLGKDCAVCARNEDLIQGFDVRTDLGLDAVHIVDVESYLVAFSTELDSPNLGQFTAGDFLATNGTIIPNIVLLDAFKIARVDLGLDAIQLIGDPGRIMEFLAFARTVSRDEWLLNPDKLATELERYNIDILFSTEGTGPSPEAPRFLDGDLLSARFGTIVESNGTLLPNSVPAGIPVRGVDFGLDATTLAGAERLVYFSTEILYTEDPNFTDGDLLELGNGVVITNEDLIRCFEPKARFLGLDAVFVAVGPTEMKALVAQLTWSAKHSLSNSNPARPDQSENNLAGRSHGSESLAVAWEACKELAFSTEEDFVTQGPVPPDGNPIISDGDLLGKDCVVCARNQDLLQGFDVRMDLGLDAVDVIDVDTALVAFSTELDSPNLGQFTAGDLLATNGTIIPNITLTHLFNIGYDIGLDALLFVGPRKYILAFFDEARGLTRDDWLARPEVLAGMLRQYGLDLWFSTEGTGPYPVRPSLLDGDLLSAATGTIVASNATLLPSSVPAGIPDRGVDFGLDAVSGSRSGSREMINFSTEILFQGEPSFTDGDVVKLGDGVVILNEELTRCFEPRAKFLGLDALSWVCIPELEWTWNSTTVEPDYDQVMMAPVVADLNDDTIPDVIFSTFKGNNYTSDGILRAISGADGSELFSITNPNYRVKPGAEPAVADIDKDGKPEILVSKDTDEIICFENDGTYKWTSTATVGRIGIAVADLDEDGIPEIVAGRKAFNNNGTVRWTGTAGSSYASVVADLDLDGHPEVVAGNTAYRYDGSIYWTSSPGGTHAIGDFDDDPYPEIVTVGSNQVSLKEHDGTLKWGPVSMPGGGGNGPPVVADMDGDGEPEIGVGGYDYYVVFETDGSIKWMAEIRDYSSRAASSSAFDFDRDGSFEIVYSDELFHRIFRGVDGEVLFETPGPSGTLREHPVIVDVDNDGHVEIVFAVNNYGFPGNTGIEVYGNDRCWPSARKIWNQHTYHITNINGDATVPRFETNNWEVFNNYRTQSPPEPCECDLNHDGRCDMQDWLIFGQDWGRTDCHDPGAEPCECDLNDDGRCDMQDWLIFGEDWGRTDCPIP
jgi:hypothetical protein